MDWTGSPTKNPSSSYNPFAVYDDDGSELVGQSIFNVAPVPLTTSQYVNQFRTGALAQKASVETPVAELLAKLADQQEHMRRQKQELKDNENRSNTSSVTDPFANTPATEVASDGRPDAAEVFRLKKELEIANERMAQMNLALTQSRLAQHTMEEAIGSPFPSAQHLAANITDQHFTQPVTNATNQRFARPAANNTDQRFAQIASNGYGHGVYAKPSTPLISNSFNGQLPSNNQVEPMPTFPGYLRPAVSFSSRPMTPLNFQATPFHMPASGVQNPQPPVGTQLSPTAMEFGIGRPGWPMRPQHQVAESSSTYVNMAEPMNYRRLLDKTMTCNWKYVVDKIVCSNDQQASIFLQQKLKVSTTEQKFEIVQAIIDQAYPLMVNRFGNFLVQRCFEHGTPEQVISIAEAIRNNTLSLSMDAFGCHVVQKAFDCVPEEYKAIMVHELLRRIPETVIHRYACHVWQKLFELRWSDSPPQIMKYVNEALRGMWREVALGETGSLVVQNIFENCLDEDKRACIDEVLASIDVVAHGQFGNWCIQHLCEHGSVPDRTRATDHVIRFATEYSTDQFASKVVEKCLKIGGIDFLDRYLGRVCEARPDRPRMPLIDIAGDQFGNYLVQYILLNTDTERREVVAVNIRKHMVSLRGSKYGSRVAMLCTNPAYSTRPGPAAGLPLARASNNYMHDRCNADLARGNNFQVDRSYMARNPYGAPGNYR